MSLPKPTNREAVVIPGASSGIGTELARGNTKVDAMLADDPFELVADYGAAGPSKDVADEERAHTFFDSTRKWLLALGQAWGRLTPGKT